VTKVWAVTTPDGELYLFADETDAHRYGWRHRVDPVKHAVFGATDTDALIALAPDRKAGES
jgi:hypothetical protein